MNSRAAILFSFFALVSCAPIPSVCEHSPVIDPEVSATCFVNGWSEGSHCSKCGEVLVPREEIPASHHYELDTIYLPGESSIEHGARFFCPDCRYFDFRSLTPSDVNMPILTILGSLDGVSKENKVAAKIRYETEDGVFESDATFKVQGASSAFYPKKNYTLQLLDENGKKNKVLLDPAWGKQSKYCLKANWIDASHARNVVSAKLYGQIVHSRKFEDELDPLVNGGAIDGFPILIYEGNDFLGLYTLNIPKDAWMFGMNDKAIPQGILMADDWTNSVFLKEHVAKDFSNGWDNEYCSTEEEDWMVDSMNRFISFLNDSSDEDFKAKIEEYTSLERSIDLLLYTYFICAGDNLSKNILWASFDGKRWIPSAYDLDSTWGLVWDGKSLMDYEDIRLDCCDYYWNRNLLWERIYHCFRDEVKKRYFELRGSVLSTSHLSQEFASFCGGIPEVVYRTESLRWEDLPSKELGKVDQILEFIESRGPYYDKLMEAL